MLPDGEWVVLFPLSTLFNRHRSQLGINQVGLFFESLDLLGEHLNSEVFVLGLNFLVGVGQIRNVNAATFVKRLDELVTKERVDE